MTAGQRPGVDYTRGVVGRDPVGKTCALYLVWGTGGSEANPDWSDERVAERINRECTEPVIDAAEVAHWRKETAR